jgi:regulator of replication initiation timing
MKEFTNELGNTIRIKITEEPISGIDGVLIKIEGPTSLTENHLTRMEAEKLRDALNQLGII